MGREEEGLFNLGWLERKIKEEMNKREGGHELDQWYLSFSLSFL